MADDKVIRAVRALGRHIRITPGELTGSMSSSAVHRVQVDGCDAVLKVTGADEEQHNARRELAFYRTLADRVPVRTPQLLDYVDNDELTAMLLSAHAPASPAREWDRSRWLEVAGQLAALHSFPAPADAFQRPRAHNDVDQPEASVAVDYWSRTDAADSVRRALGWLVEFAQAVDAVPDCFIHGDCHVDNFLTDGPELLWTDWQVTGIGKPTSDLAFLWSRANSDSADPPYDAMLAEYATRRELDPTLLRRALIADELGTSLFSWPTYLHYHPPHQRDRVTGRLNRLVGDWQALSS